MRLAPVFEQLLTAGRRRAGGCHRCDACTRRCEPMALPRCEVGHGRGRRAAAARCSCSAGEFLGDVDLAPRRIATESRHDSINMPEHADARTPKSPTSARLRPAATFTLSEHRGHPVVLYFYPKDNTPGCTTEGAQFPRSAQGSSRSAGAVVAGVSRDSLKSHESFKAKMEFPFELISDADEKLCTQFDVIKMKNMYGKKVRGIERSTFVIDGKGVLAREWRGVKVPGHADEVLEAVKAL